MNKKKAKALVLMSGGLDSMLAVKVLEEQNIEVTGLSFKSYFFDTAKAKKAADNLGIDLLEEDFSDEHLEIVKNPKHGYGKNLNPCIDCHGFMFLQAKAIMKDKGFDFLATGEVLGQRPKSQVKDALRLVEKYAQLEGKILRPLSAKLLEKTEAEDLGLVDRDRLLDIQGRSRFRQVELTKKYKIKEYPSPGGGCLLTDPGYTKRILELKNYWQELDGKNIKLLQIGRPFWLNTPFNKGGQGGFSSLLIIGRNHEENEILMKLKEKNDILLELADIKGPLGLLRLKNCEIDVKNVIIEVDIPLENPLSGGVDAQQTGWEKEYKLTTLSAMVTGYYSTKARGKKTKVKIVRI